MGRGIPFIFPAAPAVAGTVFGRSCGGVEAMLAFRPFTTGKWHCAYCQKLTKSTTYSNA